jgi:SAM-dependent methyltransferase
MKSSVDDAYADYLRSRSAPTWKHILDVQAPYRWNLRRLKPGYMLEIGCGLGRNLKHIGGKGIGVDPNPACVEGAAREGLTVYTDADFKISPHAVVHAFDSLLLSHVLEHLGEGESYELLRTYLRFVRPGGKVIFITPQELGFRSDPTHVRFVDFAQLRQLACRANLRPMKQFSFPLPRAMGGFFRYNEFILSARV